MVETSCSLYEPGADGVRSLRLLERRFYSLPKAAATLRRNKTPVLELPA
jgi:hypothetical protein